MSTKKTFDFKVGTDPEFVLTMQGRKVDAKQTMLLMLKNKEGLKYSENRMGFEVGKAGNIGWDGASSTGEVRPSASNDPRQVITNLGTLFKAVTEHIKICDLSTISEFSSVGGHIHLEVPKGESWSSEKKNVIHRKLASFYLPLLISENKINLNLRLKQGYGSIKDTRVEQKFQYEDGKPGYTMEFRCPSAEWLTTPKVAAATLSYFAVVYHEILNHPKSFSKFNDIIYKSDKQGDALQTLAIMEYDLLTNSILNKTKKYIRTFEMYKEYKDEIEYILNPKLVIRDKQKANYNITEGWNLITKTLPKKSEVLSSKKKIQIMAKDMDFDILKRVMNIHYNDDTNVAIFAENLKDRVAAFNWKLKNNYYIFGLRKGIDQFFARNLNDKYLAGNETFKTILDKEYMDRLFQKMNSKFLNDNNNGEYQGTTLDFITGKVKDERNNSILIGIPYNMRIEEKVKLFLNFIWAIEKGEITDKENKTKLVNDCNLPLEEKGKLYKILTKQTETARETGEIVIDCDSNSLRNHSRAINTILSEELNNA